MTDNPKGATEPLTYAQFEAETEALPDGAFDGIEGPPEGPGYALQEAAFIGWLTAKLYATPAEPWRRIDTAPKDRGARFIGLTDGGRAVTAEPSYCIYENGPEFRGYCEIERGAHRFVQLQAWMPFPGSSLATPAAAAEIVPLTDARVKAPEFAVFDEFGKSADDRMQDYGQRCFNEGREFEQERRAALATQAAPASKDLGVPASPSGSSLQPPSSASAAIPDAGTPESEAIAALRELRDWDHRGGSVQEQWDEINGRGAYDRLLLAHSVKTVKEAT